MGKVALINKYLPYYRLGVFKELSAIKDIDYEVVGDTVGKLGIETIPVDYAKKKPSDGGINWHFSKSFYYDRSRQIWQTNVVSKIFSKEYQLFILDGSAHQITTWIFSFLCHLAGKKILFWSHGFKGVDKGFKKKARTFFFKIPHGLLLYGNYSKELMVVDGFKESRIFVMGNSLDYNTQKQVRNTHLKINELRNKNTYFKENLKTLFFIGRLVANKKIDWILKAIYELNQEDRRFNCIIVGDGPEKESLKVLIKKYGLDHQVLLEKGVYAEKDIAHFLLQVDALLSPGNVGLNCIHALSYGIPVITHDNFMYQNPEVEAIDPFKNGIFFKYNDFEDMKHSIKQWFENEPENVSENCIRSVEKNFTPQTHADAIHKAVLATLGKQ